MCMYMHIYADVCECGCISISTIMVSRHIKMSPLFLSKILKNNITINKITWMYNKILSNLPQSVHHFHFVPKKIFFSRTAPFQWQYIIMKPIFIIKFLILVSMYHKKYTVNILFENYFKIVYKVIKLRK